MRLDNHSYTRSKIEISDRLGGRSRQFISPQMVKSLELFPMRMDNHIEVRFTKNKLQVAGRVVENVPT